MYRRDNIKLNATYRFHNLFIAFFEGQDNELNN